MIGPLHYLIVSALLFAIGITGVILRRNVVVVLMSIELILNAANINLVAFSRVHQHTTGQVFALFVMAVAVAEAAVGLAIIIAVYRTRETLNVDQVNLLKL